MRIADLNWKQLEEVLRTEDRAVVPLGSTEQHAYLSLATDTILAERAATEAAEPLGVPVFPALAYGITPYFTAYPGTVSLRVETYLRVVEDLLDNLARMGFRRILMVNGHGGNAPAQSYAVEWMAKNAGVRVRVHNWWSAPRTAQRAAAIDQLGSHASWSESFPWTRLSDAAAMDPPAPPVDRDLMASLSPAEVRDLLGTGNMGGPYVHPGEDMADLWRVGVEETRASIEGPWGP